MLCADSCFNKTLRGGSGYQVDSDKKPHNEKGRGLPGGLAHTCEHTRTNTYKSKYIKHVCAYTTRSKHREEQVACHRLVPNGIGRPVQGTVIKSTQRPIAKTGHGTKEAMKGRGTDPAITHWSQSRVLLRGGPGSLSLSTVLSEWAATVYAYLPPHTHTLHFSDTCATLYVKNAATYFLFMRALPVLGDKYLQWVAVRSVFVSRLPNHAQHVNTHLIIFAPSIWVNEKPLSMSWSHSYCPTLKCITVMCERDGKTETQNSLRKRLTFTEARMQLNFCWRILCILLPEAKKGSMAGCSAKRGSRKKDTCVLGRKAASGLWPS